MIAPMRIMAVFGRMVSGLVTPEEAVELGAHLDEPNGAVRDARNAALEEALVTANLHARAFCGCADSTICLKAVRDGIQSLMTVPK